MSKERTPDGILRALSQAEPRGPNGAFMEKDGSVTVGGWDQPLVEYPSKRPRFAPHKEDEPMQDEEVKETKPVRNALLEKPVENNGPVPLMPNLDGNARHVVTSIRVHKRTPPNDGIKGDVPESTTIDFIARRWGDGIYDFEALNESQQVLRRNTNVKIAMGYQQSMETSSVPKLINPIIPSDGISEKFLDRLDSANKRAQDSAESALQVTQKLSQDYASMIREDSKDRSDKDRAYHQAQSSQQSTFFQAMIANMQTMHEQAMERSREQFQQTMQMMQFSHQQTMAQNNPALMFQLFERGLKFGAEASGDGEPESPLATLMSGLTSGLGTVRDMMALQGPATPGMLPASNPATPPKKVANPAKKRPISEAEMLEVLRLKRLAESKGYEFGGLVKQAQVMISNAPPNVPEEESGEDEDSDDTEEESATDSESVGSANVD